MDFALLFVPQQCFFWIAVPQSRGLKGRIPSPDKLEQERVELARALCLQIGQEVPRGPIGRSADHLGFDDIKGAPKH